MMKIDLRSDTVTKPTKGMLQAMMTAKVGDDVYGEDPTVNALEMKLAKMFGKEKALFFPTGTMANQAAIKLHTRPGEQLICDKWAHVFNFEGGGASFNSGVSCKLIDGELGRISAKQVEENINPPNFYHSPLTSLVCLENTTNMGGGACYDLSEIKEIRKVCTAHHLGLHLDGARLFNALVATGESPDQYGKLFDTISICLSKGLGSPMGSVLIGDGKYMKNALRIRKILGGGMRQIGYMAAAGIYALDHHIERLAEDHRRAKEIGKELGRQDYVLKIEPIATNIVIFYLKKPSEEKNFLRQLEARQVKISSMGHGKLRIVTHLDYSTKMHQKFLRLLEKINI